MGDRKGQELRHGRIREKTTRGRKEGTSLETKKIHFKGAKDSVAKEPLRDH